MPKLEFNFIFCFQKILIGDVSTQKCRASDHGALSNKISATNTGHLYLLLCVSKTPIKAHNPIVSRNQRNCPTRPQICGKTMEKRFGINIHENNSGDSTKVS